MKRIVSFFARRPSSEDGQGMYFIPVHATSPAASVPMPVPIIFLDKGKSKSKKAQK